MFLSIIAFSNNLEYYATLYIFWKIVDHSTHFRTFSIILRYSRTFLDFSVLISQCLLRKYKFNGQIQPKAKFFQADKIDNQRQQRYTADLSDEIKCRRKSEYYS